MPEPTPLFLPGGIALARVTVFAAPAPDQLAGGTPHVHLASTEACYVLAGRGSAQTLCAAGMGEFELAPGAVVWFSPGVIHRLINADGKLEVLLIGQNGDLSLTEDAVPCLPPDVMADAAAYAGAMAADDLPAALRRRDAAVTAFNALRADYQFKGKPALEKFLAAAGKFAKPKAPKWYGRWNTGPNAAASAASVHLNNLRHGHVGHLTAGRAALLTPPDPAAAALGLCGTLSEYKPERGTA